MCLTELQLRWTKKTKSTKGTWFKFLIDLLQVPPIPSNSNTQDIHDLFPGDLAHHTAEAISDESLANGIHLQR